MQQFSNVELFSNGDTIVYDAEPMTNQHAR